VAVAVAVVTTKPVELLPPVKAHSPKHTKTASEATPDTQQTLNKHTAYSDTLIESNHPYAHPGMTYVAMNFASSEQPNQPETETHENTENPSPRSGASAKIALKSQSAGVSGSHTAIVRVPGSRHLLFDVSGEAKRFPYTASADLLWTQDGSSYNARLVITAFLLGSRIQTSAGQVTAEGLAPQRFSDKVKTEVAAHFERDKGIVSFSANTPDAPLQPGAQDRLSVLLQLGSLLAGSPHRYPPGSSISIQTVGPKNADDWRFTVGEEHTLALPEGEHKARILSRVPQRDHDVQVDVWLSADLAYLPVQLRLTQDNGDFVQLQLKSITTP